MLSTVVAMVAGAGQPTVSYPHPLITEVLYDVPTVDGDASGDGTRQVAGDEFVEVVNPHAKPIELGGYTLRDRNAPDMGQMRFTFPEMTLAPGEVAVVFNGHEQSWRAPAGNAEHAPAEPHPEFDDAWVLTMETRSGRTALANGGDYVLLSAPSGERVHLVWWGRFDEDRPKALLVEEATDVRRGSAARADVSAELVAHTTLLELAYSPGRFPHGSGGP